MKNTVRALLGLLMATLITALTPGQAAPGNWLDQWVGKAASEPLPPDRAFTVKARRLESYRIAVDFNVPPAYYLYKDRLLIALKDTPGLRITAVDYPEAITKQDKFFGPTQVYLQPFRLIVTLAGPGKGPVTLLARYQGCFETRGLCYPPQTTLLKLP